MKDSIIINEINLSPSLKKHPLYIILSSMKIKHKYWDALEGKKESKRWNVRNLIINDNDARKQK